MAIYNRPTLGTSSLGGSSEFNKPSTQLGIESSPYEYNVVARAGMGLLNAPGGFVNDLVSLGEDVASWVTGDKVEWFDVPDLIGTDGVMVNTDLGTAGEISEEVGSFALGLLGTSVGIGALGAAGKAGKLGKLGSLARWARAAQAGKLGLGAKIGIGGMKGAVVDFSLGDVEGGNLSNLLDEFPILEGSVVTFLKQEEDDSAIMKRLKNTMEGIPLGIATDYLFETFSRVLKYKRASLHSKSGGDPEAYQKALKEELGSDVAPVDASIKALDDIGLTPISDKKAQEGLENILTTPEGRSRTLQEAYQEIQDKGAGAELKAFNNFVHTESVEEVDTFLQGFREISGRAVQFDEAGNRIPTRTLKETEKGGELVAGEILDNLGVSVKDLQSMGEKMNNLDKYLIGWYNVLNKKANEAVSIAHKIGEGTASDLDKAKFLKLLEFHAAAQPHIQDIRSGVGRTLSAHRINIKGKAKYLSQVTDKDLQDPSAELLKRKLKDAVEAKGGKAINELAEIVRNRVKVNEKGELKLKEFTKALKGLEGSKVLNVIQEFRLTNILSGMSTQGVNILGNSMAWTIQDVFEQTVAAGVGALRGGADRVHFAEVLGRVQGAGEALTDYFKFLGSSFKEDVKEKGLLKTIGSFNDTVNKAALDFEDRFAAEGVINKAISSDYLKLDPNKPLGMVVDGYGKLARSMSFGVMNAADAAAVNVNFYSELNAQLYRVSLMKEIPKDVAANWRTKMKEYVLNFARTNELSEGIKEETAELVQELYDMALHHSQVGTFKDAFNPGSISGGLYRMLNSKNSLAPQAIKTFVVPFFKTPMNILEFVKKRTPLLHKAAKDYKLIMETGTQAQKDEITARLVTGSLCYMGAIGLYQSGALTGAHDPQERDDLLAAGVPEYAVKIGDTFYQYNRLDPLGYFLGLVADMGVVSKHLNNDEYGSAFASVAFAVTQNVTNKSYLKGLGDLYNAAASPERYGEAYFRNQFRALIPMTGAQKTVGTIISPELKESRSVVDGLMQGTILKGALPDRSDAFGEPVAVEQSPLSVMLGIRTSKFTSQAHKEIAKYRLYPNDKPGHIRGVKLSEEQHSQYKHLMKSLGASDRLNEIVSSDFYKKQNNNTRKGMLMKAIAQIRGRARQLLLMNDKDLQKNILERQKFIMKLRTTRPEGLEQLAENLSDIRDYEHPQYNEGEEIY